ncbi:hypothetical protein PAMP_018934 [Pampus punctatissimus]
MFAVVFAFILEECALPLSVCPPYSTCKDAFCKNLIFVLKPQLSSFPPPLPPIRQRAVFAKAAIHASKRVKPTTTDCRNSLHQLPALKAPYLLPTLQEIEASDTSQMVKSIGSCTGPCKWLDFKMLDRLHPALLDPPITLCVGV